MSSFFLVILYGVGLWKVFEKAHVKGWKALVPIYNYYCIVRMVKRPIAYFYWTILPILSCLVLVSLMGMVSFVNSVTSSETSTLFSMVMTALISLSVVLMIPSIIISFVVMFDLAKLFRRGAWFGLGLIVIPVVFILILGFDKSTATHQHVHS